MKPLLLILMAVWISIGLLYFYNSARREGYMEGHRRGVEHGAAYVACGDPSKYVNVHDVKVYLPSEAFQSEIAPFVNSGLDDECVLVSAIRRKTEGQ